jgi:hypothetical protein
MFESPININIKGYFQYLPAIKSVLPTLITDIIYTLTPYRETLRRKYSLMDPTHTGFIHVRRGDYLAHPTSHWIQTEEYYINGLKQCSSVSRWLILSDDIEWCRSQPFFSRCECINEVDELAGLAIMSLCHGGAIIANSTYSWWGAMLGPETAKAPIVYPARWLGDTKPILFRETWLRI